jgi:hypothetical protein
MPEQGFTVPESFLLQGFSADLAVLAYRISPELLIQEMSEGNESHPLRQISHLESMACSLAHAVVRVSVP